VVAASVKAEFMHLIPLSSPIWTQQQLL